MVKKYISLGLLTCAVAFTSCKKSSESDNTYSIPTTYEFKDKDGVSTVDFSGQTQRLNQLDEIVEKIASRNSDASVVVSAADLKKMYSNNDAKSGNAQDAGGLFSFSSEKQLKDKTALGDLSVQKMIEDWFDEYEKSDSLIIRKSKNTTILISDKGLDFKEIIEKAGMGAILYSQAMDNYLDIDQLLADDNTALVSGKNYTERAHHFDEGFGYFGAPIGFPTEEGAFFAEYAPGQNVADKIMGAFLTGRAAIVYQDDATLKAQVEIIRTEWEAVIAHQAISYLTKANTLFVETPRGDFYHTLTEAYGFIWSLNFNKKSKVSTAKVKELLDTIGSDFTTVSQENLKKAKDELIAVYGEI